MVTFLTSEIQTMQRKTYQNIVTQRKQNQMCPVFKRLWLFGIFEIEIKKGRKTMEVLSSY